MGLRFQNIFLQIICLFWGVSILSATPPKWIDIPNDNYEQIAEISHFRFNELNKLVKSYHNVDKTIDENICRRLKELEKIINYVNDWLIEDLPLKLDFFLKNILTIANNKYEHLKELHYIFQNSLADPESLKEYHYDISKLKNNYHPIFLCNHRMYDSFNGQYWGEYWMETIDPCHRQLTPFYELFRFKYGPNPSLFDFLLWLEGQNLSKDVPYLRFLDDDELDKATVKVKNGLLYFNVKNQEITIDYSNPNVEYIFNIDLEERLILVPGTKIIHHVSLSKGKPVLGCGNMIVKNGSLQSIELESGHYLPSIEDGVQVLRILEEKGILLYPSISFSYYKNGKKYHTSVTEFLISLKNGCL